jgi:hypothetical protein
MGSRTGTVRIFVRGFPTAQSRSRNELRGLRQLVRSWYDLLGLLFFWSTNTCLSPGLLTLVVLQLTRALASYPASDNDLKTGESRLLGMFTVFNVFALVLIFFIIPETAGATLGSDDTQGFNYISLGELNCISSVRTRDHVSYQMRIMVPWALDMVKWKYRQLLGKKVAERPKDPYQLYTWVQVEQVNGLGHEISESRVTGHEMSEGRASRTSVKHE